VVSVAVIMSVSVTVDLTVNIVRTRGLWTVNWTDYSRL
jgi:hypothetical protein